MTGRVRNRMGQALNGAIANEDSAPASSARAARFHPQVRMIARPIERNLLEAVTMRRLHRPADWSVRLLAGYPASARGGGSLAGYGAACVPSVWRCAGA